MLTSGIGINRIFFRACAQRKLPGIEEMKITHDESWKFSYKNVARCRFSELIKSKKIINSLSL